jgi:ketosteroid isomerase-like protein
VRSDEAIAWLLEYAGAWERADIRVLDLFTPDATYQSEPFREMHEGHDGIRAYWDAATSTQSDATVLIGEPLVDGNRVVAEWWAMMTDEGEPLTLPGVLLLDFDDGRCRALREYWAYDTQRREPYPGWGRFDAGEAASRSATRWAEAYARAWRDGDADAAAALYADDVVFRSHPFRDPVHGRGAVHEYTAKAFASEHDRDVRLGRPITDRGGAAVEYWTTYVEDGAPQTLAGCVLMTFDAAGGAAWSRDYWHVTDERLDPPRGWGWLG